MSYEIGPIHYTGASGLFALIHDPDTPGNVFITDGSSSDAITAITNDATTQAHAVALSAAIPNHFFADRPASLSANIGYMVDVYIQAGGSPAFTDLANHLNTIVIGPPITNLKSIKGDPQSVTDFKDFVDTGYDPATHQVNGVKLVDTTTTNTDQPSASAIAAAVELAMVNEGDATAVLQAIADKIANDLVQTDITAQSIAAAVKARMEEAGSTLATLALAAADADGLTDVEFRELMIARFLGLNTVEALDGGLKKRTYYKRDGVTVKFTKTFNADGAHTAAELDPA